MRAGKGIPFLDLITPHLELEEELMNAVKGVLRSAAFIGGPVLEQFELDFAKFCNVEHCVGVSSGTDALRFALMAAPIASVMAFSASGVVQHQSFSPLRQGTPERAPLRRQRAGTERHDGLLERVDAAPEVRATGFPGGS